MPGCLPEPSHCSRSGPVKTREASVRGSHQLGMRAYYISLLSELLQRPSDLISERQARIDVFGKTSIATWTVPTFWMITAVDDYM